MQKGRKEKIQVKRGQRNRGRKAQKTSHIIWGTSEQQQKRELCEVRKALLTAFSF